MVRSKETCSGLLCSVVFFACAVPLGTEEIWEHCVGGLWLLSEAALCDKRVIQSLMVSHHLLWELGSRAGLTQGLIEPFLSSVWCSLCLLLSSFPHLFTCSNDVHILCAHVLPTGLRLKCSLLVHSQSCFVRQYSLSAISSGHISLSSI